MPIIKAYQSETASLHFSSQNFPSCCTPGCLFTKKSLMFLTSRCYVCLHSHEMLEGPLNLPNDKKERSFMGVVVVIWGTISVIVFHF